MRIGLTYPPTLPPSLLPDLATVIDGGGIDELWLIEVEPALRDVRSIIDFARRRR